MVSAKPKFTMVFNLFGAKLLKIMQEEETNLYMKW